jgi:hypothetical protein
VGSQHHDPAALPPGKTRYPLHRRLGKLCGPLKTWKFMFITDLNSTTIIQNIIYSPVMWEMEQHYASQGRRNILHTIKRRQANWTGHIFRINCILKQVIEEETEDEEEGVSSYGKTLRKTEYVEI